MGHVLRVAVCASGWVAFLVTLTAALVVIFNLEMDKQELIFSARLCSAGLRECTAQCMEHMGGWL